MSLLAIDVGAGTQDILLYDPEVSLEGSTKMILPSQTVLVGNRINRARMMGRDIFLCGPTMGGGSFTAAVRWHLAAGLKVFATPSAAATINDDLEKVAAMGVVICEEAPSQALEVKTGDIDIAALQKAFALFDLDLPQDIAVAVQDHGFSPHSSNRLYRFECLAQAIRSGGSLKDFAYRDPPQNMTRMLAVQSTLKDAGFQPLLMDTGPAALFGAALDLDDEKPALVINFGNGHTVAAVLAAGRITGIFEHHTAEISPEKLGRLVRELCQGTIKSSEVFQDGGHGAYVESVPGKVEKILVTGPRRQSFLSCGAIPGSVAASPAGDMMITGCIGLLEAWKKREELWR